MEVQFPEHDFNAHSLLAQCCNPGETYENAISPIRLRQGFLRNPSFIFYHCVTIKSAHDDQIDHCNHAYDYKDEMKVCASTPATASERNKNRKCIT